MKANQLNLRLIKIEGINLFFGKGVYNTETNLCTEKSGFLLKKTKSIYLIDSDHVKRSGNKAYCFVDLGTHKSLNPHTNPKDNKLINQIQYLTQKQKWEANIKKRKLSKWEQLILLFCGMGVFFFITSIIRSLGIMF